jgi:hypothetical protein
VRFRYAKQTYVYGTGWVPSGWLTGEVDPVSDLLHETEEELSGDYNRPGATGQAAQGGDPRRCTCNSCSHRLGTHRSYPGVHEQIRRLTLGEID